MRIIIVIILSSIALIGTILMIWGLIEAAALKVTRDRLIISKGSEDAAADLRILFFSDLHREFCMIPARRVCALIRAEKASQGLDAVIFGGDLVIGSKSITGGLKYITAISDQCKALGIPFMAVTGNHDTGADPEELGMFPFDNMNGCIKYLKSRRDGRYVAFAGVPDTGRRRRLWSAPPVPSAGIEHKSYILLSHNPDLVLHMPPVPIKVDAMISGHIHGGQIRTPFGLEFKLRHDELPYQGVISGIHEVNGIKLFISKGIGCVFVPFRFFARPEVNIIEIVS